MPAYAVLRIQKLKSWGDIAGFDAHNFRERETPNADEERTPDNVSFAGKVEQDSVAAIKEAICHDKVCVPARGAQECNAAHLPSTTYWDRAPCRNQGADLCRHHGFFDATVCQWCSMCGRDVTGAKRVRHREEKNGCLTSRTPVQDGDRTGNGRRT